MEGKNIEEFLKEIEFAYELHDFQMKRLIRLIEAIENRFGSEVLQTVREVDVNYKELIRWYLKRTASILDALKDKYGEEVLDIVSEIESQDVLKSGICTAKERETNTLEDIIKAWGDNDIVEKNSKEVVLRRKNGCPVSRISRELGITDLMYKLHCNNDPYMVKGLNENFGCEVRKSHMCGDDYCEWYIYDKKAKSIKEINDSEMK